MTDSKDTFTKVEKSSQKPMYGPRGLLVCGMDDAMRRSFQEGIDALGFSDLPVVFVGRVHLDDEVGDLLNRANIPPAQSPADAPLAIVMSGMTEKELHTLVGAYRQSPMPRPLWASLTPTSEHWPLGRLLSELAAERAAIEARKS